MHLRVELRYEAAPEQVAAMLADKVFVRRVIESSQGRAGQVEVTGDATGAGAFTVTSRRFLPTNQIPAQMRSFVGAELEVRHATAWGAPENGQRRGSVAVEIVGTPVRATGTTRLVAGQDAAGVAGAGTVVEYDAEVKASVPLFGASVEQAATAAIRSALEAEERVGGDWLTR